jgi:hypothetical protein
MLDSSSWEVISGAEAGQVVLGVDFPARRPVRAGFLDLATRIGPGYRFLQTKPPMVRSCQRLRGDAYVGPWISGIRQGRHQVLAVCGYRIGSVYAAAIAEGIAQWQAMPKIILFDPQVASIELLSLEFCKEIGSITSLLGDDEIERAGKVAAEFSRVAPSGVADVAAEMVESYLEIITAPFERVGLGDARSNKFTIAFEAYMSWLSTSNQIDPSLAWKSSTGIASSAYAGRAASDGRPLFGQLIPFEVSHADLLRSDCVAQAVRGLLESQWGN